MSKLISIGKKGIFYFKNLIKALSWINSLGIVSLHNLLPIISLQKLNLMGSSYHRLDGFCGAGGDSIKMAFTCKKVISNDIDPIKI